MTTRNDKRPRITRQRSCVGSLKSHEGCVATWLSADLQATQPSHFNCGGRSSYGETTTARWEE